MTTVTMLNAIGQFSQHDVSLFGEYEIMRTIGKNECLLKQGDICRSLFYILSGSFYQFTTGDTDDHIIDLHLPGEWMFNHESLMAQSTSTTSIKAFVASHLVELKLQHLHALIARSAAFLQFGRLFNQAANRTHMFDNQLSPAARYHYINQAKPGIAQAFPVKMIASYLKIAPETLSRVRARQCIS